MEDNKNRRYQDNGCSFVVEVQPSYQDEAKKGSSTDDADQQALVHREEIAEDRKSGTFRFNSRDSKKERRKEWIRFFFRGRFRKHEAVREHEHGIVAVGSLDLEPRLGKSQLPLRQSNGVRRRPPWLPYVRG